MKRERFYQTVDKYYFVDESDKPINFSLLPLKWDNEDSTSDSGRSFFLRGGEESIYKLCKAWKFDISDNGHPKIQVLLDGLHWITLQKPNKTYEALVRPTLATLHCLHFIKRNPDASSYHVWNSLPEINGIKPSEDDLSDHVSLLCQAMKRDEDLTKSKCLRSFLEKTSGKTPIQEELPLNREQDPETETEHNSDVDIMTYEGDMIDEDDSETNLPFDPVCSICDNGGYVLCCEGTCLRSFHPTIDSGTETDCESLGFSNETQVKGLGTYLCNNCLYKQHQCYACGQLGSSDENASSQEVFACSASNCGHFYHPKCVAKLLHTDDQNKSEQVQAKIAANESFCCPLHICKVCNLSEDKNQFALHFAVCRRCPTAYHRKCLPSEITTELNCNEDTFQRAWEKLLPYNRILIYCLNHEIEDRLFTPIRDHLIFPDPSTGPKRTQSHGLAQFEEDLPRPSKEPVRKHHGSLYARLGLNDTYRKQKKSFLMNDYLAKRKTENLPVRKYSREDGPSASATSSQEADSRLDQEAAESR